MDVALEVLCAVMASGNPDYFIRFQEVWFWELT
jgi:hypothetical protein